jgi:hypothetical protein
MVEYWLAAGSQRNTEREICSNATSSNLNLAWSHQRLYPHPSDEDSALNRPSYDYNLCQSNIPVLWVYSVQPISRDVLIHEVFEGIFCCMRPAIWKRTDLHLFRMSWESIALEFVWRFLFHLNRIVSFTLNSMRVFCLHEWDVISRFYDYILWRIYRLCYACENLSPF